MVTLNTFALVIALAGTGETVLLDFTSPSCAPCRTMEPTVARLTRDGYHVRRIDVGQHPEIATKFQVTGVPCFVMVSNGREIDRVVGACSHARLVEMYKAAQPQASRGQPNAVRPASNHETVRAQSPESQPAAANSSPASLVDPRRHAFEATIRLRIEDAGGHSVGTGTIVDTHGSEALAITCGHIFRDSGGQGRVLVDLFPEGRLRTVEGMLISYDLTRDVGLVSFTPGFDVSPVRIAPAGHRFATGDPVFTVGCDNGAKPSLRDSRITSIDRYLGPPNIETTGEPTQGRSGGGLFSQDGLLIGICNHGDPQDDEGIYASLPTIHWELDRVGQRRLYQPNAEALAWQGLSPSRTKAPRLVTAADSATRTVSPAASTSTSLQNVPGTDLAGDDLAGKNIDRPKFAHSDTEVICIVRSRGNPQARESVYILEQPSSDLLDQLARESRGASATRDVAARNVRPATPSSNAIRTAALGEPVVRAQSADGR